MAERLGWISLITIGIAVLLALIVGAAKATINELKFSQWCVEASGTVIKIGDNRFCAKEFTLIKREDK